MNSNLQNQNGPKTPSPNNHSNKLLVILISTCSLLAIVGIFILYILKKPYPTNNKHDNAPTNLSMSVSSCNNSKIYSSVQEAIKEPAVACILDLTGKNLSVLPQEILLMKNLRIIYLTSNNLTEFPKELLTLTNLEKIYLSNNKIKVVPKGIQQLAKLSTLNLTDNHIASLPPEIGRLENLSKLFLGSNELNSIPQNLASVPLETLDLSGNLFSEGEVRKIKDMFPNTQVYISTRQPSPTPKLSSSKK